MQLKIPFHFDMETADPDDAMTLAILATHPRVHLASVSVHPGGTDQIGFVRKILTILDREDIRIGAGSPKSDAQRVSGFHRDWVGGFKDSEADGSAVDIMTDTLRQFPDSTLLTGAALTTRMLYLKPGSSSTAGSAREVLQGIMSFRKNTGWKNLTGKQPAQLLI